MATPPRIANDVVEAAVKVTAVPVAAAVETIRVASATAAKAIEATMYPIMLEKNYFSQMIIEFSKKTFMNFKFLNLSNLVALNYYLLD